MAMSGYVVHGTAQDCVDHLRKTHDISQSMKAANLARYFPPWTVARSQWSEMTRPAISGVAIDSLLFSRIGVPLFHRYRIVSHAVTHVAFRGTYMRRLHAFLEEMNEDRFVVFIADVLRRWWHVSRCHQVGTQQTVQQMFPFDAQSLAGHFPGQSVWGGGGGGCSCASDTVSLPPAEAYMVQALMDLALPRFAGLGDGPRQFHAPWTTSSDSPASPATSRLDTSSEEDIVGLPSPCLDLDELSSSEDDLDALAGLSGLLVTLLCGSDEVFSPVNSDQVLSDPPPPPPPG